MDAKRFDRLSRTVGEQTTRRTMFKAAAASTLAVVGMGALGRTVAGKGVNIEAGFEGDSCDVNADCGRGLSCNTALTNPRCEYPRNCGGKKGDACKNDNECCNNRNLICQNRKCKRNKRNN